MLPVPQPPGTYDAIHPVHARSRAPWRLRQPARSTDRCRSLGHSGRYSDRTGHSANTRRPDRKTADEPVARCLGRARPRRWHRRQNSRRVVVSERQQRSALHPRRRSVYPRTGWESCGNQSLRHRLHQSAQGCHRPHDVRVTRRQWGHSHYDEAREIRGSGQVTARAPRWRSTVSPRRRGF